MADFQGLPQAEPVFLAFKQYHSVYRVSYGKTENSTFHYLGLFLCLLFPKQNASPMTKFGDLGAKGKNRVQPPHRGLERTTYSLSLYDGFT